MMKKLFCIILFLVIPIIYIFPQTQNASATDDFVLVQGGSFFMGSENGDEDEKPAHKVTVDNFYICKHEVTQSEWLSVMENNPSYYKGEKRPVEQVSWFDAIEYCNLLSKKEGLEPCYEKEGKNYICNFAKNGYRLPTEAEWEYSASGGLKRRDSKYSGGNFLDDFAWYENNCNNSQNVMTLKPNELGLYDMSGNVWEWCWDKYGKYSKSAQINPLGVSSGAERVIRGGRWRSHDSDCRVTNRSSYSPKEAYYGIGFRVVRTAEDMIVAEKTEGDFSGESVQDAKKAPKLAGENEAQNVLAVNQTSDNTDENEELSLNNESTAENIIPETKRNDPEWALVLGALTGGVMISKNSEHIVTPDFGIWGVPLSCMAFCDNFGFYCACMEHANFSIHTPFDVYGKINVKDNNFSPKDNLDDSYEYYFEPDGEKVIPFYYELLSIGLCIRILKYTWISFGGAMIGEIIDMHGKLYYRPKDSSDDYSFYGEGYAREEGSMDWFQLHLGLNLVYEHLYCGVWYKYNFKVGHQIDMNLGYAIHF